MAGKDDHGVLEKTDSKVSGVENSVKKSGGGGWWGYLIWAVAAATKVIAVVVVAMYTNKLSVGIILCCLLLFLEFGSRHFSCVKKTCSNEKSTLQYMARRIGNAILVLRGDVVVKEKNDDAVLAESGAESVVDESGAESDSSCEEVEVVKRSGRSVCIDEGNNKHHKFGLIEYLIVDDEKWKKIDEGDHTDDLLVSFKLPKGNGKGKRKSMPEMGARFMKKMVPKKSVPEMGVKFIKKLRKKSKKHQSGTESEPIASQSQVD